MQPHGGLELVWDEAEVERYSAVRVGQGVIGAEAGRIAQAVGAEHPGIQRNRLWIMRMPEVLPERPSLGGRFGINKNAVLRGENYCGFRHVTTKDAAGPVAGEHFPASVFDAR